MNKEEIEQFENVLNELATKCAEFVINKGTGQNIDLERFIVDFILSFDINYYDAIGILEEAKYVYRDIILNHSDEGEEE